MTTREPLVVHLFGTLNRGGAEMRTLELVREDSKTCGRHLFIALSGQPGVLDSEFRELGCEVVHLPLGWSFPLRFARLLQSRRPTVVHSHVHLASAWFLGLARVMGVPGRIAHLRSQGDGHESRLRRRAYRAISRALLLRTATAIVAVSGATLKATGLEGAVAARIVYDCTPVGARPDRMPDEGTKVLFVGRLDPDKDPVRAIQVFGRFRERFPEATFDVVGDQQFSEAEPAQWAVEAVDLVDSVHFLGVRQDVRRLLARSNVLLMTTRREGLPGVLIESLAEGTPVVASAIAPVEEVAVRTRGVITMPLDADDNVWAEALEAALAQWGTGQGREEIQEAFAASPFAWSDTSVANALSLWRTR